MPSRSSPRTFCCWRTATLWWVADGLDRGRLTLIAPFSSKPEEWIDLDFRNRFDGQALVVTTSPEGSADAVRIETYGDSIAEYGRHPEARASRVRHIGKESNQREEVEAGGLRTTEDPVPEYLDELDE